MSIGSNIFAMKFEKHAMKIKLDKYLRMWLQIYLNPNIYASCIQQLAFLSFFYSYLSLKGPWASVDIGILESYLKSIQQIFVGRKRKNVENQYNLSSLIQIFGQRWSYFYYFYNIYISVHSI